MGFSTVERSFSEFDFCSISYVNSYDLDMFGDLCFKNDFN